MVSKNHELVTTGTFRPGIVCTICTNQFHFSDNGRESLKLVPEMAVKKWNTNFRLEHAVQKNGNPISYNPFLQEIFHRNDPKSRIPFTF